MSRLGEIKYIGIWISCVSYSYSIVPLIVQKEYFVAAVLRCQLSQLTLICQNYMHAVIILLAWLQLYLCHRCLIWLLVSHSLPTPVLHPESDENRKYQNKSHLHSLLSKRYTVSRNPWKCFSNLLLTIFHSYRSNKIDLFCYDYGETLKIPNSDLWPNCMTLSSTHIRTLRQ